MPTGVIAAAAIIENLAAKVSELSEFKLPRLIHARQSRHMAMKHVAEIHADAGRAVQLLKSVPVDGVGSQQALEAVEKLSKYTAAYQPHRTTFPDAVAHIQSMVSQTEQFTQSFDPIDVLVQSIRDTEYNGKSAATLRDWFSRDTWYVGNPGTVKNKVIWKSLDSIIRSPVAHRLGAPVTLGGGTLDLTNLIRIGRRNPHRNLNEFGLGRYLDAWAIALDPDRNHGSYIASRLHELLGKDPQSLEVAQIRELGALLTTRTASALAIRANVDTERGLTAIRAASVVKHNLGAFAESQLPENIAQFHVLRSAMDPTEYHRQIEQAWNKFAAFDDLSPHDEVMLRDAAPEAVHKPGVLPADRLRYELWRIQASPGFGGHSRATGFDEFRTRTALSAVVGEAGTSSPISGRLQEKMVAILKENRQRMVGVTPLGARKGYMWYPDYADIGRLDANLRIETETAARAAHAKQIAKASAPADPSQLTW